MPLSRDRLIDIAIDAAAEAVGGKVTDLARQGLSAAVDAVLEAIDYDAVEVDVPEGVEATGSLDI